MNLKRRLLSLFALLSVCYSLSVHAVIETYEFGSDAQRVRYQHFIDELRCPKCQNQNLAGSNSPIAADLRRELHRMILEGKNDDYIVNYMVSRYGEFVLYRPRLDRNTAILWSAPVIFALIGFTVVVVIVRNQKKHKLNTDSSAPLSAEEKQQLKALLERYAS